MNDIRERYVETALDELYNGGPSPELEQRILQAQPVMAAATSRWWLVSAACVAVTTALIAVVLFSRLETAEDPVQRAAPMVGDQEPDNTVISPVGLGNQYANVEGEKPEADKPDAVERDAEEPEPVQPTPPEDFKPDPDKPITLDFVGKSLHTVMHYIALRSGLQIIVEGEVEVKLTVMFRDVSPKDAIQSICKANNLDYIEDGDVIIIKRRPVVDAPSHVEKSQEAALYNVSFEEHELVAAIIEVATVTKTQVFVPAVRSSPESSPEAEDESRMIEVQAKKITLYMTLATPDQILRRLAEIGELDIELVESETGSSYKFTYRD